MMAKEYKSEPLNWANAKKELGERYGKLGNTCPPWMRDPRGREENVGLLRSQVFENKHNEEDQTPEELDEEIDKEMLRYKQNQFCKSIRKEIEDLIVECKLTYQDALELCIKYGKVFNLEIELKVNYQTKLFSLGRIRKIQNEFLNQLPDDNFLVTVSKIPY